MTIASIVNASRGIAQDTSTSFLFGLAERETIESVDSVFPMIVMHPPRKRRRIGKQDQFDVVFRFLALNTKGLADSPIEIEELLAEAEEMGDRFLEALLGEDKLNADVEYLLVPFTFENSAICSGYTATLTISKSAHCYPDPI